MSRSPGNADNRPLATAWFDLIRLRPAFPKVTELLKLGDRRGRTVPPDCSDDEVRRAKRSTGCTPLSRSRIL